MAIHKILFVLDNKADVDRTLMSEPWCFDKHLVIMQCYDNVLLINELQFDKTTFWVQAHGIPIRYTNIKAVEKICGVLGYIILSNNPAESERENFIRTRVALDVSGPLCRGHHVSLEKYKDVWIGFK